MRTQRLILYFIFLIGMHPVMGQVSEFTQYFTNLPSVNPAFTGIDDYLNANVGFRQGWNDFSENNYSTYFSAYGTLNKPLSQMVKSNSLRVSDPTIFRRIQTNKQVRRKHGLGGLVGSQKLGPSTNSVIQVNYAYHLPVSKSYNLSMGTTIGYQMQRVDFSQYTVRDQVNDLFFQELLNSGATNLSFAVVDFGATLYADDIYFGLATTNMIFKDLTSDVTLTNARLTSITAQVGKNFDLDQNLILNLGIAGRYTDQLDPTWIANARLMYKNFVYLGAGYQNETKVSILFGLNYEGKVDLNYSYDKYIGDLSNFNLISHEIIAGIVIFNKFNLKPKFW